jgi:hypothetical protein
VDLLSFGGISRVGTDKFPVILVIADRLVTTGNVDGRVTSLIFNAYFNIHMALLVSNGGGVPRFQPG